MLTILIIFRAAWTVIGVLVSLFRNRNEDLYSWRPVIEMGIAIVPEIVAVLAIKSIIRDWRDNKITPPS